MNIKLFSFCSDPKKGNAYFLKSEKTNIILDTGFTKTNLHFAIEKYNIKPDEINGVFLTHHHQVYTKGLKFLLQLNPNLLVFATEQTHKNLKELNINNPKIIPERKGFKVGDMKFYGFPVKHTTETYNFTIENNKETLAYITNTGNIDKELIDNIGRCEHFLIESNYHPGIARRYGIWDELKYIVTTDGHLSNEDACEIVARCASDKIRNIFLVNISKYNNKNLARLNMEAIFNNEALRVKVMPNDEVSEWIDLHSENEFVNLMKDIDTTKQKEIFEKLMKL